MKGRARSRRTSPTTLSGCIGCVGDLETKRSHFGFFLGDEVRDVRSIARDYELHLDKVAMGEDGTFEHESVTVKHPTRHIVSSEGFWGGCEAPTLGSFSIYRFSDGSILELGKSHLAWEPFDPSWLLDQLKKEITEPMSEQLENELRNALANCIALRS